MPAGKMTTYHQLFADPPITVPYADVIDLERIDERISCIDCLDINILGVVDGAVEWCPNEEPPSKNEKLAWLWFIRRDLAPEIAQDAPTELCHLMDSYRGGTMEAWWKEVAG